jgi:hypothetical protein
MEQFAANREWLGLHHTGYSACASVGPEGQLTQTSILKTCRSPSTLLLHTNLLVCFLTMQSVFKAPQIIIVLIWNNPSKKSALTEFFYLDMCSHLDTAGARSTRRAEPWNVFISKAYLEIGKCFIGID